ncbi:hypothetical protein [Paractinoplanes durhamensis]|uniref:hypothetical protein n=1 Tax=Paractinoplanes durhamensis TaxID=113563 RepID=UPI00363DED03
MVFAFEFAGPRGGGLDAEYDCAVQDVLVEGEFLRVGVRSAASAISRFNRRSAVAACSACSATGPVAVSVT